MVQYNITFMTHTQILHSHFFHLLWADSLQPFFPLDAIVLGRMSEENYERQSPCSYVVMVLELQEFGKWQGSSLCMLLVM